MDIPKINKAKGHLEHSKLEHPSKILFCLSIFMILEGVCFLLAFFHFLYWPLLPFLALCFVWLLSISIGKCNCSAEIRESLIPVGFEKKIRLRRQLRFVIIALLIGFTLLISSFFQGFGYLFTALTLILIGLITLWFSKSQVLLTFHSKLKFIQSVNFSKEELDQLSVQEIQSLVQLATDSGEINRADEISDYLVKRVDSTYEITDSDSV